MTGSESPLREVGSTSQDWNENSTAAAEMMDTILFITIIINWLTFVQLPVAKLAAEGFHSYELSSNNYELRNILQLQPLLRDLQAVGVIPVAFLNNELKYATSSTPQRMAIASIFMSVVSIRALAREILIVFIYSVDVIPVMALSLRFMCERVRHISEAMKS